MNENKKQFEIGDIRRHCLDVDKAIFQDSLRAFPVLGAFAARMAIQGVIESAIRILRTEWAIEHRKMGEETQRLRRELEEERAIFSRQYNQARETIPEFDHVWEEMRLEHNSCARLNLGDDGKAYAYVIPSFHGDGKHDKVGPKDGPWGR